ncbi:MAG: SUMF1/EgtB/PvdO family nonheme iron enzyme [Planctomycetia bacterium]|nr:SUMF1/EgtB/PvdO family nonheme iron enzyme [Planctomycetia bacterium]
MTQIGDQLDEFRLRRLLGRGGMGEVYEAYQSSLDRHVALKILPDWLAGEPQALERFRREAAVAAQLDHPNILPIYSFGQAGTRYYYTMKLVRGLALSAIIHRCLGPETSERPTVTAPAVHTDTHVEAQETQPGKPTAVFADSTPESFDTDDPGFLGDIVASCRSDRFRFVARIGEQLAQALACAHRQGQIHRDIKPSNVMVDCAGQVYLIDFGLTRAISPNLTQGRRGTPRYMSPEQIDLGPLDGRSDIYSLGVTLYELAALRPAFSGDESSTLAQQIRSGESRPLEELLPEVPRRLARSIRRAMHPHPQRRFQTAEEMAAELAACLTEVSRGAADKAGVDVARSPARSKKFTAWLAALAIAAAFASAMAVWQLIDSPGDGGSTPGQLPGGQNPVAGGGAGGGQAKDGGAQPGGGAAAAASTGSGKVHPRLPTFENSLGMAFVQIPPGEFNMGASESENGSLPNERPVHHVHISRAFWIGRHEVTQLQYGSIMGQNPGHFSVGGEGRDKVADQDTSTLPVENVTWDDAIQFCQRLSDVAKERQAGRRYRLLAEAEWEYACRAETQTPFHFGDSLSSEQANFNGSQPYGDAPIGPARQTPSPVGSFPANAFGLHDMHGNVAEWCNDPYEEYRSGAQTDPQGTASVQSRVMRGGAATFSGADCRSAWRAGSNRRQRSLFVGFRVACDVEQKP